MFVGVWLRIDPQEEFLISRRRFFPIKKQTAPGDAPGTMIAPADASYPIIDIIAYGPDNVVELSDVTVDEIRRVRNEQKITWVNVSGRGDADLIRKIGEIFELHQLAMEDVMNLHHRPKVEEYDDHIFLVSQMFSADANVATEQVALFLGSDFVLSIQESPGDCFGPLRNRIRQGKGRVRAAKADYLFYALLDAIVDEYFPVLEQYGEALEKIEDGVVSDPDSGHIAALHDMKRELLTVRRAIWPHREMVNTIIRDENALVTDETRIYFRDVYDHTIHLMDIVETYREIASGLVDVYISSVSAKLNEIMKVLTIIATIFIPLGFVASLYGMNFDRAASPWNMPELGWRFGYLLSLAVMAAIAGGLLYYFRRRGWLGARKRRE
jgi:magnesium transporter